MWPWDKPEVNLPALYSRLHGTPVLNPFVLPRGHELPADWKPFISIDLPTKEFVKEENITAVVMDTSPWSPLSEGEQNTLRYRISQNLGSSISLGCAEVWMSKPIDVPIYKYHDTGIPDTSGYSIEPYWIP